MRDLTKNVQELETGDGRFWVFCIRHLGEYVLCRRKRGERPTPTAERPWDYAKVGSYPTLEAAQGKAADHVEGGADALVWV